MSTRRTDVHEKSSTVDVDRDIDRIYNIQNLWRYSDAILLSYAAEQSIYEKRSKGKQPPISTNIREKQPPTVAIRRGKQSPAPPWGK